MKSDIEIAQNAPIIPIVTIAKKANIPEEALEFYGKYKAKINVDFLANQEEQGKLILVTAITPTKAGEGKTTTTIGLGDALNLLKAKPIVCLREPSMGPVFGLKGGAAGGGYSQVIPMEDINLHFTGDMHAITSANNLVSACLDNSIFQGNPLNINPERVVWKRCLDVNDRALRHVEVACGKGCGIHRKDGFVITVATEIMAIMCLSKDINDFKEKVGKCIVAYTYDDKPIRINDLGITGSLALLMKEAMKPNLVQTLGSTPVLMHGGPFANIAHGCNSLIATKTALKLGNYVVTEAGFGADLGAEKFFNIKCREGSLKPKCAVIVATIRALKMHGGVDKDNLDLENIEAIETGFANLEKHIENIRGFGIPYVVAINRFSKDTNIEIDKLLELCKQKEYPVALCNVYEQGGEGAIDLAQKVIELASQPSQLQNTYRLSDYVENKIKQICCNIYGAKDVVYSNEALTTLNSLSGLGMNNAYICMAKTPNSFSDNDKLIGRPNDFVITVKEIRISAGANFIVVLTGSVLTMPGLPKSPAANKIDLLSDGKIVGLF